MVDGSHLLLAQPRPAHLVEAMIDWTFDNYGSSLQVGDASWKSRLFEFLEERQAHLFERRGFRLDEFRSVRRFWQRPDNVLARLEALSSERTSTDFLALLEVAKRVSNITQEHVASHRLDELKSLLKEPAELALASEIDQRWPKVNEAVDRWRYVEAIKEIVRLRGPLDRFFTEVLVMSEDPQLRAARLSLLAIVRDTINQFADLSQIAPSDMKLQP
jgi:glycyl-tRNA synthetase beta chain